MKMNKGESGPKFHFKSLLCWLTLICGLLVNTGVAGASEFWPSGQESLNANQATQIKEQMSELLPGKPIERELKGGEVHAYRIRLAAGQYLHLLVDKRGIDVVVSLIGPNGEQLLKESRRPQGMESLLFITKASGPHQIEVKAKEKEALPGSYELKIEPLRTATPQDEQRITTRGMAIRATEEAIQLNKQASAESRQKAVERVQEARQLWQTIGDRSEEAHTLIHLGWVYGDLSNWQQASEYHQQALALFQAVGDRSGEGAAFASLSADSGVMIQLHQAIDYARQALVHLRATNHRLGEASVLAALGGLYAVTQESQEALDCLRQALSLWRVLGRRNEEAQTLTLTALVYQSLGDSKVAADYFDRAKRLLEAGIDSTPGVTTEDKQFAAALAIGEGSRLMAQATSESRRKAIEKFNEALQAFHAVSDQFLEATTLRMIGVAYSQLGENLKAVDYFGQELRLWRMSGNRYWEGLTLSCLGEAHYLLGEKQKAHEYVTEALRLMPNVEDKQGAANARYLLARIEQDRDQLIEARSQVEAALDLFESVRLGVTSQEFRASFLAKVHEVYQFHIDLLMRLYQLHPADGYDGLALQAGERARARSLLEMLTEARADIRQGVDPALVERERKLQEQINAKERRWLQIVSGKHSEEQAAAAKKDVETALTEYHELQAKIRATSPRYAALTQPQPLGLKEIQEQVLDEDTLLLEYAIGEERSFLFAVTPTAIKSYELPKRAEVEAAAKRVYELLTERNRNPAKETLEQRRIRFAKADAEYAKAAAALSQMILGPVAEQLGTKRLLIVSDGALQYVPFAALPKPVKSEKLKVKSEARAGQRTNNSSLFTLHSPLILDHEIVSLPSASVLAVLRKEWAQRPAAAKTVAVLADPVFSENDPRVKPRKEDGEQRGKGAEEQESQRTKANPAPPPPRSLAPASEMKRSARDLGVTSFERLRFSGIEADGIAALAPAGAHLKAVDFEANKSKAMSPELDQYRLVHLATHGLINSQHPELSGIVLSLVNENGQPQDGFLRLHEVYNLKLSADLVVLSACQTALGREVKGEGLIGLTRGFMYAGAARVVASLWNVEDKATATLMRRFYQQILTNGQRPAAALRVAQVSMWQEKKAPYFWAAFLLQGEWR